MAKEKQISNGYFYEHQWFNFLDEIANGDTINVLPTHSSLMWALIHQNNLYNWKEKFPAPTAFLMKRSCIKSHETYKKVFKDLEKWGFVKVIKPSINLHVAKIVTLLKFSGVDDIVSDGVDDIVSDINKELPNQNLAGYVDGVGSGVDNTIIKPKTSETLNQKNLESVNEISPSFDEIFLFLKNECPEATDWRTPFMRKKAKEWAVVVKNKWDTYKNYGWKKKLTEFVVREEKPVTLSTDFKGNPFPNKIDYAFLNDLNMEDRHGCFCHWHKKGFYQVGNNGNLSWERGEPGNENSELQLASRRYNYSLSQNKRKNR